MKSDVIDGDDVVAEAPKSVPALSTIALRFVTLLAGIVVLAAWAWSR